MTRFNYLNVKKQFGWRGQHFDLEYLIEKSMNDPDSYEHIETHYRVVKYPTNKNEPPFLLVTTKFRGKNAFGAKVTQQLTAKVDANTGTILKVESR